MPDAPTVTVTVTAGPVKAAAAAIAEGTSIGWTGLLRRHAHLQPDAPALRFEGRSITYAALDARVEAAAGVLGALGVGAGDRVAVLMGNRPELIDVFGGAARLGAITVPINFRLVGDEIAFLLGDSGASVLVVDEERHPEAVRALAGLETPIPCLVTGGPPGAANPTSRDPASFDPASFDPASFDPASFDPASGETASGETASWETAVAAAPPRPAPTAATLEAWRAEGPSLIMYTSGTTGRPKGAVLSHLNLLMQTMTRMRTAGATGPDSVGVVVTPLFHISAIGATVPSLITGGTTVLVASGTFDPGATLDLVEREGCTTMFLVPTQWQAVCEIPGVAARALQLQSIVWGASPAPPSTLQAMEAAFPGVPNTAAFGQTEMSPVTCALEGRDAVRKTGSVGTPVPTVDVRIVDEDMCDVAPGLTGEIVYRGAALMSGYWRNPAATAEAMEGGWFHSGDLVRVDDEGFITVVDRKKDMIISGGENIYSSEVEAAIDGHPKVREVAVVAGPHPRWVETPVAFVVPADPSDPPTAAELIDRSVDRLASYKRPTRIEIVDVLPRNASGKVLKTELRQRLRDDAAKEG